MNDTLKDHIGAATVLVVDDNPENLRVLREMLTDQGCEVRVAKNGKQALRSVEAAPPDLILLDIHMPGMDGYEVCRQLKADARWRDIPVIFVSALGETFNKVAAYDSGGADYITKPFQFEELRVRMRAHIRTRHLLAESQAGFRSSFEQAVVGMVHLSVDGVIVRANRYFCDMLGYTEDALQGKSAAELTEGFSSGPEGHDWQKLIDGEIDFLSWESQYLRADGSRVWCKTTVSLVVVDWTHERYLAAIVEDLSSRRTVEDERRQLAAAIDQAAEAIIITTAEGVARYANPAWEQISGMTRADTFGRNLWLLRGVGEGEAAARERWAMVASGKKWTGRLQLKRPDDTLVTVEMTASPVRDDTGAIANFVTIVRDITDQIALEERLLQAQKMEAIGTLAGGIAHDFNNILSAIMGYTDLAIQDLPEDTEVRESLLHVLEASHRAKELVAQILAFSRQSRREVQPIEIQSIVKEALKLLRGSIPSTIDIRHTIDPACPPVMADGTAIHQIVMNLCTNAYHAMRDTGGVLALRLSHVQIGEGDVERDQKLSPGRYVRLEVEDTGHGMDEETRARIFEPYYTTKERGQGTGLGLATVHGIVSDLNGVVHVYSEPGAGSTFTLLLPVAERGEVITLVEDNTVPLRGTESVLLVDDEVSIGAFAKTALERLGYRVTVASNGKEALAIFTSMPNAFDVVVTDQMMPRMRGLELSRRVHALRSDIPVILCSGFAESVDDWQDSGDIQGHVMKPIIGSDLARAIRSVLSKSAPTA